MESSIAEFLMRQLAFEQLPTYEVDHAEMGWEGGGFSPTRSPPSPMHIIIITIYPSPFLSTYITTNAYT